MSHQHKFDLQILERDADTSCVIAVAYRICISFNRECKVDAKTPKMTIENAFDSTFRLDNYLIHLNSQHPFPSEKYQTQSNKIKLVYFDIKIFFVNTILSHFDRETNHVDHTMDMIMIKYIIREMLWELKDVEG